jgi:ADP-ribosylglycohydrolase
MLYLFVILSKPIMRHTLENLFTGLTVGDAYGTGLEFQDRNWIRTHVDFTKFINRRNDINTPDKKLFTIDYHDWDYTDDAEMTIAVTKAICSGKPFTEEMAYVKTVAGAFYGYLQKLPRS